MLLNTSTKNPAFQIYSGITKMVQCSMKSFSIQILKGNLPLF